MGVLIKTKATRSGSPSPTGPMGIGGPARTDEEAPLNTDARRHLDAPLDLVTALFGPDLGGEPEPATAAVGKVWGSRSTGRGTVLEVRIGWLAGQRYMQFLERTTDDTNKHLGSILIDVTALPDLAACLADLARYEGGR